MEGPVRIRRQTARGADMRAESLIDEAWSKPKIDSIVRRYEGACHRDSVRLLTEPCLPLEALTFRLAQLHVVLDFVRRTAADRVQILEILGY